MLPLSSWMRTLSLAMAASLALSAQEIDLAERLFQSGDRAYAAKSFTEAFETWQQLLQSSPKSPFAAEALLRMARHRVDVNRQPDEALPLLERIKTDHIKTPFAADAMLLRGTLLAARSRKPQEMKEAVAEFNRVLDLFPDHPAMLEAHFRLGLAAQTQGQWGRALQEFLEVLRMDPSHRVAPQARLQAAEVLDIMGDLPGCLRMLQDLRNRDPRSPEAAEAEWRMALRVKHRLQKPPFRSEGLWPQGRQRWLKTPTLLAMDPMGNLVIYQDGANQASLLKGTELSPIGTAGKDAKAIFLGNDGKLWYASNRTGLTREDGTFVPLGSFTAPTGAFMDAWGTIWVADARTGSLGLFTPEGLERTVPSPSAVGLAKLPTGGAVLASDANRALLFLDAAGQPKTTIPYGKDLPAGFRNVIALCADPVGHVAAIVDGEFEGVVLWGPDGSVLRSATFKTLGITGKFKALALDRQGGLILADRTNDVLFRLN